MGWNKGKAWFSGMCHECGKKIQKGETCYIEVKGIFPQPKAICEECFKTNHSEAKVESQVKTFLKRLTFRTK
jgi:NMD protein affecting ribosome stability and mRNA decay